MSVPHKQYVLDLLYFYEYLCGQIISKWLRAWLFYCFCVSWCIAYYSLKKEKTIYKFQLRWLSMPQFYLSPALVPFKPCLALWGCKRAGRRLAGHLCTFLKALKDAQHVYPLSTNNKGRGCVTKGHQHGRDGAGSMGGRGCGGSGNAFEQVSVCVRAHDWLSAESH